MEQSKISDFNQGIFYAAGLLVTFIDEPVIAADILTEAGLADADISGLDDAEKEAMIKLMKSESRRIRFTGV